MVVRTVLGDRSPEVLGKTHCHDHLFVFRTAGVTLPDKIIIDNYEKTREEVMIFKVKGGGALVDAQPFGAGRHARFLHKLSEDTGVQIIAATGFHKASFYNVRFWSFLASVRDIADLFISEIEEGMYEYDYTHPFQRQSSIKAGVIKIATDRDGLSKYYKKVFDAAVHAHRATGAPIITHTEISHWGMEQASYLIDRGIKPDSIIISHMDREIDIPKNRELAELGVFLEYDTIARFHYHTDAEEIALIAAMVDHGYDQQILLGMDSTRDRFSSYGSSFGLDYILQSFIPMLQKSKIQDISIDRMMLGNPKCALSLKNG
jgi:phosphotriesterase-related protein